MTVPVYDARNTSFDVKTDLGQLDNILPTFQGEVPIGSCVAVGHRLSSYVKSDNKASKSTSVNLGTNLLFVIVLGTPH
jgi:hypothetical protein